MKDKILNGEKIRFTDKSQKNNVVVGYDRTKVTEGFLIKLNGKSVGIFKTFKFCEKKLNKIIAEYNLKEV